MLVLTLAFILVPSIALSATIQDAENFWKNGQKKMALNVLANILTKNPANGEAWFTAGNFLSSNRDYLEAINAYTNAVSHSPNKYEQKIVERLTVHIRECLRMAHNYPPKEYQRIKTVRDAKWIINGLWNFIPANQRSAHAEKITYSIIEEIKYSLEKSEFRLADIMVAICPGWGKNKKITDDIYNIFMDYGDRAEDRNCLPYYAWLNSLKIDNHKNKAAAARLWSIGKKIESEYIDKDFDMFLKAENYKNIARQWDQSYPPKTKSYGYGEHPLEVEPKEVLEYWAEIKLPTNGKYTFKTEYGGPYMLIFEDGTILVSGKGGKLPSGQIIRFKMMPIDKKTKTILKIWS